MRLITLLTFLLVSNISRSQHVSNVYYNVVDSIYITENLQWYPVSKVDWNVTIDYIGEYPVIYTNGEKVYTLTTNLIFSGDFQKWLALDYKGESCHVILGRFGDLKYMQIQYPDMGWCNIFD